MEGRGHGGDKSLLCSSWLFPCLWLQPGALRTHVSRGPAGCGEHTARVLHLGEAKVGDHDLGVFVQAVVQQILWLGGQEGGKRAVIDGQRLVEPSVSQALPEKWAPKSHCSFMAAILFGGTRNSSSRKDRASEMSEALCLL